MYVCDELFGQCLAQTKCSTSVSLLFPLQSLKPSQWNTKSRMADHRASPASTQGCWPDLHLTSSTSPLLGMWVPTTFSSAFRFPLIHKS